jgi:hypothetical protein
MRRWQTLLPALMMCAAAGCSDPETIAIEITTGHESDTFSLDPAVTRVDITGRDNAGEALVAASAAPGGAFELGEIPIDQFLTFDVDGFDVAGDTQVRGRSLGLVLGALESDVFPVFAQRVMRWSRPPDGLPHSHRGGLAGVLGERYLFVTGGEGLGGEAAAVSFYDQLALGGAEGGVLGVTPKSMVVSADAGGLLVFDDERGLWLDFDSGDSFEVALPPEIGSWSQIAGGRTIVGEQASYVVGATRTTGASDRVLVIAPDRSLSGIRLQQERAGAAAAVIADVGLVIAGGAGEGAGVETLVEGETATVARPFEADPTVAAVAVAGTQGREMLLLCGQDDNGMPAVVRALDLGCGADCTPRTVDIDLGRVLSDCTAFALSGGRTLLIGSGDDGIMTSLVLTTNDGAVNELPLREARVGAAVTPAPNGSLAIMGGALPDGSPALTVELLWPQ